VVVKITIEFVIIIIKFLLNNDFKSYLIIGESQERLVKLILNDRSKVIDGWKKNSLKTSQRKIN
jgi:hypothetical protein